MRTLRWFTYIGGTTIGSVSAFILGPLALFQTIWSHDFESVFIFVVVGLAILIAAVKYRPR
jgi:hypothetical protein